MPTSSSTLITTTRPRPMAGARTLLVWTRRALLGLVIALVTLAGVGALYQAVATEIDARAYPPPGQLVDVGGYRLHLSCVGEGSPTVILDHVGAASSAQWGLVQPEIAGAARVCAYDRAGFGWSDPGPTPRDAAHSARELHALLSAARVPGPYVLVGHSFGANVARLYVAQYPAEVAGLVLVDPGYSFDRPGVPPDVNAAWKAGDQWVMRLAPFLSRLGVVRLAAALGAVPGHGDLPPHDGAAFDALNHSTKFWDTLSAQNDAMAATSAEVLGSASDLGARPVVVLSADQPDDRVRRVWTEVNADPATASTHGRHRVVAGATHMGLVLERDHVRATVAAILQVVDAVRTGQPLRGG